MQSIAERKRSYNPCPIRRRVDLTHIDQSRVAHFKSYSMTREGPEIVHHPAIDLQTGSVRCTCEWHEFKLARLNPTVWSEPDRICKHGHRAIEILERRNLLPQRTECGCIMCHSTDADAYYPVADETTGEVIEGKFICDSCCHDAMDSLHDAEPETDWIAAALARAELI